MSQWLVTCAIALQAGACSLSTGPDVGPAARTLPEFESQLDRLRAQLAIPGMAAIVMVHDAVVWEGSLGIADIPAQSSVTPLTEFHLASLTKTFASTIVLQLVEEGLVGLDDPIANYGITLQSQGTVRVRHLLSHTSEGLPGDQFRYNGDRFALLDQVIQQATGESFATRVVERIVAPPALEQTAPNPLNAVAFAASGKNVATYIAGMATGYGVDDRTRPVHVAYPNSFSSAAGLVSTARDVARYSTALDAGQFLGEATRTLAYTPARGAGDRILPYGLGWFISTGKRAHTGVALRLLDWKFVAHHQGTEPGPDVRCADEQRPAQRPFQTRRWRSDELHRRAGVRRRVRYWISRHRTLTPSNAAIRG